MNFNHLWVEKYRPKTLADVCMSDETKKLSETWGTEIPHLLLVGNAGGGKTTISRILVEHLLKCDYLYINASDENGIDTIRMKVTGFVQTKSLDGGIKVVILDEADGLTPEGQKCLRNLMESYAHTARFVLTGNYKHKISIPIQSRCQDINILPPKQDCIKRCIQILKAENIKVGKEELGNLISLVNRFYPDLRKCIGELQKCCTTGQFVYKASANNNELCEKIFKEIQSGKTLELRKYLIENETSFNSDWDQLLKDLLNHVYDSQLEDIKKKAMILIIADFMEKSSRISDKEINFFSCILNLEQV